MLSFLLAADLNVGGWSLGSILITIVVIAACVGIVLVALKVFGVKPPVWAVQIFWIVLVAVVAILAIKFVLSL